MGVTAALNTPVGCSAAARGGAAVAGLGKMVADTAGFPTKLGDKGGDLVAAEVAGVVVQQAPDRVRLRRHRMEVGLRHAVRGKPHVEAEPGAERGRPCRHRARAVTAAVSVEASWPSACRIAAVFSAAAGAFQARVCGKINAQARPCGM